MNKHKHGKDKCSCCEPKVESNGVEEIIRNNREINIMSKRTSVHLDNCPIHGEVAHNSNGCMKCDEKLAEEEGLLIGTPNVYPLYIVSKDNEPVFSIDGDGVIEWTKDGEKKICDNNKDLALALAEALLHTVTLNTNRSKIQEALEQAMQHAQDNNEYFGIEEMKKVINGL